MKKTTSMFALTGMLLIMACSNKEKTISTTKKAVNEKNTDPKIIYGTSVIIDRTDVVIYPLLLNEENYGSYSRSTRNNYWNIIFSNVTSGKSEFTNQ